MYDPMEYLSNGKPFVAGDWNTWSYPLIVAAWVTIMVLNAGLDTVLESLAYFFEKRIPMTGKYLEKLQSKDRFFILFNRFITPLSIFQMMSYATRHPELVRSSWNEMTLVNTFGAVFTLFFIYDMLYVPFHYLLHHRVIYKYIHKHHHRNAAPSRGNVDANNTHPVEYVIGEYLHLVALYLTAHYVVRLHVASILGFFALAGILASMNHTRVDLTIPGFYSVRSHDLHHHKPTHCYGQYTMYMDKVIGTYVENPVISYIAKKTE